MIAERTRTGRGLKLWLSTTDAQLLATLVAQGAVRSANAYALRRELLAQLSDFGFGRADGWQKRPGAVSDATYERYLTEGDAVLDLVRAERERTP